MTTPEPPTPNPDGEEVDPTPEPDLLTLSEALPPVTDTADGLAAVCADLAAGTGPVAIDAERASGYRYSNRAYLIQLRREGTSTALVDPTTIDSLEPLQQVLGDAEWILHAATQDLPCLAEIGLVPSALFDTELAGRLLGYPRVGLATLVETILGFRMKKEHSAADWSTRPLPPAWLEYAALDVEVLVELRDALAAELVEAGKDEWAAQEFEQLRGFTMPVRVDPWRRTSGLHRVRGRRALAAVQALWEERDGIAAHRDVTPGRIIPDSAIVAAASAMPTDGPALLATKGFHGRGAERYLKRWVRALQEVAAMDAEDLPSRTPRGDGPPVPRAWAEKDPVAARRLAQTRQELTDLAQEHQLPLENLLSPDTLRRTLWSPPASRVPDELLGQIVDQLRGLQARGWQIALTAPVIVRAILEADLEPEGDPAQDSDESDSAESAESAGSAEPESSDSGSSGASDS